MSDPMRHARSLLRLTPLMLALGLGACDDRNETPADQGSPSETGASAPTAAPSDHAVALEGEPVRVERRDDGLVVEVFAEGSGPTLASGETGVIDFVLRLADGKVMDSSVRRKASLRVPLVKGRAVPGLLEGLEGMRVGESRRLHVPSALAYGDVGRPPIPPKADLVFDVVLVGIEPGE
jgi:FKBP-type peptidyl-prolyl cis-trans isomerase